LLQLTLLFSFVPQVKATDYYGTGFETGHFDAGTTGSPTIVSDPVHHGSYAMEANATGDLFHPDIPSALSTAFFRAYVRFSELPTSNNAYNFFMLLQHTTGGVTDIAQVGIYHGIGADYRFVLRSDHPNLVYTYWNSIPIVDTWYSFEIKYVNHPSNGEYRFYINGNERINRTGVDTSGGGDAERIIVGGIDNLEDTMNADCIMVADTYIGTEITASPVGTNTTYANVPCLFFTQWESSAGNSLSHYIFSTNITGSWNNDTAVAMSGTTDWSNVTKTTPASNGTVVGWKIYANDTVNDWSDTGEQILVTGGYTLNLRATTYDGYNVYNVTRIVIYSITYPNSTEIDYTSDNSAQKSITGIPYGVYDVTIKWGTHVVRLASIFDRLSVTTDTTIGLGTRIRRLNSGENYILLSLNNTYMLPAQLVGESNILLHEVSASGSIEFKADHLNWKRTDEPTSFAVGTKQYNQGVGTWAWTNSIFSLTETYEGTQDISMTWAEEKPPPAGGPLPPPSEEPTTEEPPTEPPPSEEPVILEPEQPITLPLEYPPYLAEGLVGLVVIVSIVVFGSQVAKKKRNPETKQFKEPKKQKRSGWNNEGKI